MSASEQAAMPPHEAVERALALSTAHECVVIADATSTVNLRWAGNTLTTNGDVRGRGVTVIALDHRRDGVAVGALSRPVTAVEELRTLVADAEAVAAGAEPAADAEPLPAGSVDAGFDRPTAETGPEVFDRVAAGLGDAFADAEPAGRRLYGYAEHTVVSTCVGSSGGLRLRDDRPSGRFVLTGRLAADERSSWAGVPTTDFADVDVAAVADEVARRLSWGRRRVDLPAGRRPVVLSPSAVGDLMAYLYAWTSAAEAADGNSVFSAPGGRTRLGERLLRLPFDLLSDPLARGMECAPFVTARSSDRERSVFDNGMALRRTAWIDGGTLAALPQSRAGARRAGGPATPRIDNLVLALPGATASLDELVAGTDRGVLVTCLWYLRSVEPKNMLLTGLTRDGVYLVERGEVIGEVNNFRFNESAVDLLSRVDAAGATVRTLPREQSYFTRAAMPALRVPDFNLSTVSQAW